MITRRAFVAGLGVLPAIAKASVRTPAVFVQHGPYFPLEPELSRDLSAWGKALPKPRAIVALTPHFGSRSLIFGPSGRGRALYNVPDDIVKQLPRLDYASPPDDDIAARVAGLLDVPLPPRTDKQGLESTLWMPLMYLVPSADVPVLQISFPLAPGADLFALGRRLAPLRDEGVMIVGSGATTHNLALWSTKSRPAWAHEFIVWTEERLAAHDVDALCDWRNKAPAPELNHPDNGGHFRTLLFVAGAALDGARVAFPQVGGRGNVQLG